jgi:hypothetical protein
MTLLLRSVYLVQVALQGVQPVGPQASIRCQPLIDRSQRLRPDAVEPTLRVDLHVDRSGLA